MEILIAEILAKYPWALPAFGIIGFVVVVAQVVVLATPSKKDDEILAKIESNSIGKKVMDFFISFAPIQKSGKGLELSNKSLGK